jgi:hypothetical protein
MNQKEYNQTPKGKYIRQRANADRRGIPWEFTFETWWKVWEDSGMWDERGVGRNAYCMSRINDEGPYCPGNVEIKPQWENSLEVAERRWSKPTEYKPYPRATAWDYPHANLDAWVKENFKERAESS